MMKLNDKFYGGLAFGMATLMTSRAAKADGIKDIIEGLTDSFKPVAGLISVLCYLGGAALVAQGLLKLKNHIDAPDKAPLKDGLGRLVVGTSLIAIPFIVDAVKASMGADSYSTPTGSDQTFHLS